MKDTDKESSSSHPNVERLDRKIEALERLIRQMRATAADLGVQVLLEEARARQRSPNRLVVSAYAQAAAKRRDTIRASIAALRKQLAHIMRERDEAIARHEPNTQTGSCVGADRAQYD
jgi:hypothetical protein